MKILVFGSDGFIGRNVCKELKMSHEVIEANKNNTVGDNRIQVNLIDKDSVAGAINNTHPEVIINCAGVVNTDSDVDLNVEFTKNILEHAVKVDSVRKVVICGSASEYGLVDIKNIPVDENTPLNASSGYGLSKLKEEQLALRYQKSGKINVLVLRIFNPIGVGMADRFLLMSLLHQIKDCRLGQKNTIEISRLDSARDYISIADVAVAFRLVVEGDPQQSVYNVGSGDSTTNEKLLELMLKNSKLENRPKIIQVMDKPEPLVASQADITRISDEFGWRAVCIIDETVEEICSYEDRE